MQEVDCCIECKYTNVRWECPGCGTTNREDYEDFDDYEIWYEHPTVECKECGLEVRLGEKDYG